MYDKSTIKTVVKSQLFFFFHFTETDLLLSLSNSQKNIHHSNLPPSLFHHNKFKVKEDSAFSEPISFSPLRRSDFVLPYTCLTCGKNYMHQYSLDRHMLTHQGTGRHYSCPICDKQFTQKPAMKRHMKTIHSSIQCHNCDEIHTTGDNFNKHILHCQSNFP